MCNQDGGKSLLAVLFIMTVKFSSDPTWENKGKEIQQRDCRMVKYWSKNSTGDEQNVLT